MSDANTRNRYFDTLFATPDLAWMGQNTNHVPAHPAVGEAMVRSVVNGEFNAYAPPMGFEALRAAIVADLGAGPAQALVTEGGVNALAMICRARAPSRHHAGDHRPDMEMAVPVRPAGRGRGDPDPDLRPPPPTTS